jgi:hypothetical protein
MAPLFVLVISAVLLRVAGRLGIEPLSSWKGAGRAASSVMFMFTGATHFSPMKHDYAAMIPDPRWARVACRGVLTVRAQGGGRVLARARYFLPLGRTRCLRLTAGHFPRTGVVETAEEGASERGLRSSGRVPRVSR